jgi:hypothetical protein
MKLDRKYRDVRLLSPDAGRAAARVLASSNSGMELEIPEVSVYSVVVLE